MINYLNINCLFKNYPNKFNNSGILISLILGFSVWMTACTESGNGTPSNIPDSLIVDSEEVFPDITFAAFDSILIDRRKENDTVAVENSFLEKALPDSIPGFKAGPRKGSTFRTADYIFSEAVRVFYDEQTNDYIEFNISDYSGNPDFIKILIERFKEADGIEVEGVIEKKDTLYGFYDGEIEYPFSWTLYDKNKRRSQYFICIDFRYVITVEQSGVENFLDPQIIQDYVRINKLLFRNS